MIAALSGTSRGQRLLAEFTNAQSMLAALDTLQAAGYHDLDTFTPFDLPEIDRRLGLPRSRLGWIGFAGGVVGLVASYGIQWWANVHSYPLNSGGRPANAVPAFVLSTFEGTILSASLALFLALLVVLRLPRLWSPEDEVDGFERASIDRFWISMPMLANEAQREGAERLMQTAGAVRTVVSGKP